MPLFAFLDKYQTFFQPWLQTFAPCEGKLVLKDVFQEQNVVFHNCGDGAVYSIRFCNR
jgi:hypothetical protein